MSNPYAGRVNAPMTAVDVVPVTPDDGVIFNPPLCELEITGDAGDLVVETLAGTERTITASAGFVLRCGVKRVLATGTTATGVIGYLW